MQIIITTSTLLMFLNVLKNSATEEKPFPPIRDPEIRCYQCLNHDRYRDNGDFGPDNNCSSEFEGKVSDTFLMLCPSSVGGSDYPKCAIRHITYKGNTTFYERKCVPEKAEDGCRISNITKASYHNLNVPGHIKADREVFCTCETNDCNGDINKIPPVSIKTKTSGKDPSPYLSPNWKMLICFTITSLFYCCN